MGGTRSGWADDLHSDQVSAAVEVVG